MSDTRPDKAYEGQIIEYTVRPLAGIPIYWMTEITHVRDLDYFVDEQRIGPYRPTGPSKQTELFGAW